ncbi:MAG: hypothetical protein LBG61_00755 [Burkholderiales bacterium]|nr:hypothetical protein [Burkholderiales bacterium]
MPFSTSEIKQLGLALFCLVWIAIGLTGHAPWKTDDARTIVTAVEMVERHDYLVPYFVGTPRFDFGVLVPQLSAAFIHLFSKTSLAAHDAARLAAGIFLFVTLLFTALAARQWDDATREGARQRYWLPMFVLIGTVGLFDRAHQLSPLIGAMAGMAIALYGLALIRKKPGTGGAVFAFAVVVATLSYRYSILWLFFCVALFLPMLHTDWRTRVYAWAMALAFVLIVLLCAAYPLCIYLRSPALFSLWAESQAVGFDASSIGANTTWLLRNIWWVACPSWMLIGWAFWIRARGFNGGCRTPSFSLFALSSAAALLYFIVTPDMHTIDALIFLVPFALLASEEIDSLPRGGSAGLDWFGILTFGLAACALWYFWWDAYINGLGSYAAKLFRDAQAGYHPTFRLRAASVSLLLTVLWVMLVRPARQSSRRALLNWAAGMMLISGMVSTIWMPYLDSRRSYEVVAKAIRPYTLNQCVNTLGINEATRAIFYYYTRADILPTRLIEDRICSLFLAQSNSPTATPMKGYTYLTTARRYGDDDEYYVLYRKNDE